MVVAERQRHQLVQVDAVLAVQRQQLRRQRRQLQAALHRQHRHAEARRHVLDALALVDQRLEGLELVGRVHGLAPAVLGEADLQRALGRHQLAQHLVFLRQRPRCCNSSIARRRRSPAATANFSLRDLPRPTSCSVTTRLCSKPCASISAASSSTCPTE
jgi:hypothetical protein